MQDLLLAPFVNFITHPYYVTILITKPRTLLFLKRYPMNNSDKQISTNVIKSYSVQSTIYIPMWSALVSFACSLFITGLLGDENSAEAMLLSIGIGFSLTNYYFMKKILSAVAIDATRKGVTEELVKSITN